MDNGLKILILPFGIFFLLLTIGGYATNVTQCAVLSENDTIYTLNTSFTNTTADVCINITGFNNILDCQGYFINGTSSSYGIYVSWPSIQNTNVTIKNCTIANWLRGVYLDYAGNNTIADNIFSLNYTSAVGIETRFGGNDNITNNTMTGTGSYGIKISGGTANVLARNNISISGINSVSNIYFSSSTNNNLTNNTLNNSMVSIDFDTGSYGNILSNNTITHTSNQKGLLVIGSSSISNFRDNIDETNTINGNPIYYIDGVSRPCVNNTVYTNGSSYGYMAFVGCSNITIQTSSPLDGVMLAGTTGSTINNLNVSYTQYPLWMPAGASNNTIVNNIFNNNDYAILLWTNSNNNNITNNTVNNNAYDGIHIVSSSGNVIANGSIASSAQYDYYLEAVDAMTNFTNTNFTASRKIYFSAATDWFSYSNDTTSLQLRTNGATNYITRTLNSWTTTNMSWNDSDATTNVVNYTLYGLIANNNYTIYNNSILRYTLNASSCGCLNFTIDLTTSSQTVQVSTDIASPTWSANNSSTPTNYSSTPSQFNITWNDNVQVDKVFITIRNSTEILINNASMSNTYGGSIYNYSIVLPAGTFNWTSYANDTKNNWNLTSTWSFIIGQAPTSVTLYLNGSTLNQTSMYPNSTINATAISNVTGLYVQLFRNGETINNVTSLSYNISLLGVSNYTFTANILGNDNYSSASNISLMWNVSKGSNPVNLYLNGTLNENRTNYTYPQAINATGTAAVGTVYLYRDGVHKINGTSPQSENILLGNNTYAYKVNATGNANYSDNTTNLTFYVVVSKGTPDLHMTIDGAELNKSMTYDGTTRTVIGYENNDGDSDVNYTLWRNSDYMGNGTVLGNGTVTNTQVLTAATYNYVYNNTAGENYTASSVPRTLVISAASSGASITGTSTGTSTSSSTYVRVAIGKANITSTSIIAGNRMVANIAKYQDVAIRGMNITVTNNVANIKIVINKIAILPSTVPYDIPGTVYHYISIDKMNITDSDINTINFNFAVNKTWLNNSKVDPSNITLYRWANSRWNNLNAVKTSESAQEVFYNANSSGLSVFVIGTKGIIPEAPAPTEETTCTEDWKCTPWSACSNNFHARTCTDSNACGTTTNKPTESEACTTEQAAVTPPSTSPFSIISFVIVIVIAIIISVFIFLERAKITDYFGILLKKTNHNKKHEKTSYMDSLPKKIKEQMEDEEEKFYVKPE